MCDKKISTENLDTPPPPPPSYPNFFDTRNQCNSKGFPYGNFRHWEKNFDGKTWYSPPPPIHKLFGYRKFSETQHRRLPVRNFSALWDKRFSTENLDTPPPYPNIFYTRNQCNSKGFPYGNFRYCETKIFRRTILILPPPLLSINFFSTGNSLKHSTEGFTCETFRQCEAKNFRRKNLDTPPALLSINFSLPENFWNTAQKGSRTKFFGTVRQKFFDGKSWYSPPPLIYKLFRCRKFSETQDRRVHLRNFSAMCDEKISTENLDTPPPLIHKLFRYRKFSETQHRRVHLQIFSALRQKKFDGKSWSPPLLSKLFRYPKSMQQ